jgi:hypothetical protein
MGSFSAQQVIGPFQIVQLMEQKQAGLTESPTIPGPARLVPSPILEKLATLIPPAPLLDRVAK